MQLHVTTQEVQAAKEENERVDNHSSDVMPQHSIAQHRKHTSQPYSSNSKQGGQLPSAHRRVAYAADMLPDAGRAKVMKSWNDYMQTE